MARILVASLPFAGHVGVLGALAAELSGRGHDIVAYTGAKYLDKPEVARRVAWSGAGLNLRRRRPGPSRIRTAVQQVLSRPGFRRRAGELAEALDAAGGARRAASLVEQLIARPGGSG